MKKERRVKRDMAKGIYRRGNIYWIRYAGLDGKTVFESSGSEKFKDAEDLYIKRKNTIKDGKQPEIRRIANHIKTPTMVWIISKAGKLLILLVGDAGFEPATSSV